MLGLGIFLVSLLRLQDHRSLIIAAAMKSRHLAVSRSPCLDKSGPDFHLGSSPGGIIENLRAFTKPLAS
jgi:hypothetical protein